MGPLRKLLYGDGLGVGLKLVSCGLLFRRNQVLNSIEAAESLLVLGLLGVGQVTVFGLCLGDKFQGVTAVLLNSSLRFTGIPKQPPACAMFA